MRTFDEAFADLSLTATERAALVWQLATIRNRKLVEKLLPQSGDGPGVNEETIKMLNDQAPHQDR